MCFSVYYNNSTNASKDSEAMRRPLISPFLIFPQSSAGAAVRRPGIRPRLKKVKTPRQSIFFHCAALKIFETHNAFLQIFASPSERFSRCWTF
jgi:hypothetical protein